MLRETTLNEIGRDRLCEDAAAAFVMDEETFRAFYDRTARGLWAYLARVCGDRALAEDLMQEAFYSFLRASSTYTSEQHRRNSLYRIATNLAHDARRRQAVRGVAGALGIDIERVPSGQDAATAEKRTDFTRAMDHLRPRERAMLWLAYAEGASHREIAETLGLSPASMKPMLFRARKKLAALLGGSKEGGRP